MMAPAVPHDRVQARQAGDAFAPEFLLAAACCRWPPSESRNAAIRSATASDIDWNEFLRIVGRQRVGGLVHEALLSAEIACPPLIATKLAQRAERIARRDLIVAAESARLQRALEQAGIPVLVLKGVALAQLAYGSAATKQTRDIDLLVPPDRAEAALQILERQDYALSSPAKHLSATQRRALVRYGREVELRYRGRRLVVELQWRAADNPLLLKGVDAHSPAQSIMLANGARLRTLAPDDLFAYLCVHGARHSWSRLKWLADVNALIAANAADIAHLYRHAQRIGAGLCAAQALLLCRQVLGLTLPAGLADEMKANKRVERLVAIALAALTARGAETERDTGFLGVIRSVRTQFLLGQGWRFYAAQCRAIAVAPADAIRWPLPPALHFVYPLLRLPLWLWRRAAFMLGGRNAA
jgi:hypothetical protein